MKKIFLMLFLAVGALWLLRSSWAAEPLVCPPGCISGSILRECPPGTVPGGITWCTSVLRECETVDEPLPTGEVIRAVIAQQQKIVSIPAAAQPLVDEALTWSPALLENAFYRAVSAARCYSGEAPGPADPDAVPDAQVKAWLLSVLDHGEAQARALRPLVASLPDSFIASAWRAAVQLKRSSGGG